ncbi:MAG: hypothetical protein OXC91_04015 [Rhodobacteraceae bacterium]|nr:hypothetical protein [Paracoccaceae bacterium]
MILRLPDGVSRAIEIKRTTSPKVTRGFHIAAEGLGAARRITVYASDRDVPVQKGVDALPLASSVDLLRGRDPA